MHEDLLSLKQQLLQTGFPEQLVKLPQKAQVAWREAGDASSDFAVVLLHGISSGAASWLDVALQLGDKARVLAWDAPGYGVSTPLAQSAPADADYAQVLAQSLLVLGVRRCLLVGHSLGALMAARLAVTAAPGLVEQLVLISPAGGYGAPAKAEQQAKVREGRLAALAEKGVAGLAAVIDQRLVSSEAPEAVRAWVRWNTARMQPQGYAQAVELLCGSDLAQARGRLGMPVEVWVGEHDVVTTPAACKSWSELLGAHYGTLAAAGHASPVEQPMEVAHRLASLLNQSYCPNTS
ncbi:MULTISPECIES: alpha/beta fold hydrolase [Comamonas]|uniref:alpha/beta fold hydrolase n=1 Tax=Comamonas TaxID=283 RepID=UPI0006220CF4|nr:MULTISPECIES: alpha/beta hydrolase [Comamonas]KKI15769.1 hydrolase [Comamonas thiooxydans]MDH1252198.1 alpha/beta hydrolase [Comamonas thiooxydans]TYK74603.1 alpha/beta hydrolase [Comamonas sp. Z1]BCX55127.1 alpha/beta hydrolase [Comamonas testosteroni]